MRLFSWLAGSVFSRGRSIRRPFSRRSRKIPSHPLRLEALEPRAMMTGGMLDTTFGTNGVVADTRGAQGGLGGAAIQVDGKIVAGGGVYFQKSGKDFAVARYNADGSRDTSFGIGGMVTTDFTQNGDYLPRDESVAKVAVQADGKIVAAGLSHTTLKTGVWSDWFVVARYLPNGVLDTTFGTGGKVITDIGYRELVTDVGIQADGKIVVCGGAATTTTNAAQFFAVVRYNANGTLDSTFGTGGVVHTTGALRSNALALQADGKIDVVGKIVQPGLPFGVVRYNTNGTLDASFGNGGIVATPIGARASEAVEVAVMGDGRIVVGGKAEYSDGANFKPDYAVVRYLANGQLDSTFGTGGVTTIINGSTFSSMALEPNGQVVVAASGWLLTRLNVADGSVDTSFGNGGSVQTNIGTTLGLAPSSDGPSQVVIQPDAKIVVVGSTNARSASDFALARYLGDPPPLAALDPLVIDYLMSSTAKKT